MGDFGPVSEATDYLRFTSENGSTEGKFWLCVYGFDSRTRCACIFIDAKASMVRKCCVTQIESQLAGPATAATITSRYAMVLSSSTEQNKLGRDKSRSSLYRCPRYNKSAGQKFSNPMDDMASFGT